MALKPFHYLLQHLRLRVAPALGEETSDGQMLHRFLTQGDETAFAVLMQRHGPMVLGICGRLLVESADVEDAFQATFLVLVRRAASVRKRESVGSFLHGVALRIAHRIRSQAQQRRLHERQVPPLPSTSLDPVLWCDLRSVLDEELDRLPEKYRAPLVLCYLEGKTHEEAARQLGWTNGTVCGRLARARNLLRGRLVRRGLTLSTTALPAILTESALSAPVPAILAGETLGAVLFHTGQANAGILPARVMGLTEETVQALVRDKVNSALIVTLSVALLAGAAVVIQHPFASRIASRPPVQTLSEQAANQPPRADALDSPLPAGAIARLGQTRFRHGAPIAALVFAPDGKTLAAVSKDSAVILWDALTGEAIRSIDLDHSLVMGFQGSLAFRRDGKTLAIGRDDTRLSSPRRSWPGITLWDCLGQKGHTLLALSEPRTIRSIAFGSNETHWAAADDSGGVYVGDGPAGDEETRLDLPNHVSYRVVFSHDGKDLILATCGDRRTFGRPGRGEILFWSLTRREIRRAFFVDRENYVEALSLSADGKTLAVLSGNKATLWDLASGEKIRTLHHDADVFSLAFAPDGKSIALGGRETISLLNPESGEALAVLKGCGKVLAFRPDSKILAAAGSDCTIRMWEMQTGHPLTSPTGHTDAVAHIALSPDGTTVVSADRGGTVCAWNAATGALNLNQKLPARLGGLRITPDGQILATADSTPYGMSGPPKPLLWNVRTGKELLTIKAPAKGGPVCPVAVSPDGKSVATGIDDTVAVWHVPTGTEQVRLRGCTASIFGVSFTEDGTTLSTREVAEPIGKGRPPDCIRLWDVKTGRQLHRIAAEELGNPIVLSHDGTMCATCHRSGIDVWNIAQGSKLRSFETRRSIRSLALSRDGKTLLSGDNEGTICVWDIAGGRQTRTLIGHRGAVTALAFLDDHRVVSASSDTTLLIWDLAEGGLALDREPQNNDFHLVNRVPMPETNKINWRIGCLLHTCPDGLNWTSCVSSVPVCPRQALLCV